VDYEPYPDEVDDEPRYRPVAEIGQAELYEALMTRQGSARIHF
jgi:hypothetical protein